MSLMNVRKAFTRLGRPLLAETSRLYRSLALRGTTFIVVTGSCGKTTTKELIAAALQTTMPGFRSPGNGNTPWHVPRLVLQVRPGHAFSVIELSGAGETLVPLEKPLRILQPSIAVVTNIGTDHFAVFRDLDATAAHKGKLVAALDRDGVAVLNADDPRVFGMRNRCKGRVLSYGFGPGVDVRGTNVSCRWPDRLSLDVSVGGRSTRVRTQLSAAHLAPDVLAALAVAHVMGVPLDTAAEGVARVEPFPGRMSPVTTADGITFMRDDQKAPMWTIPSTLEFLENARAPRKIVVLGTISDFPGNPGRKCTRVAADILDYADALIGVGTHGAYVLRARPRVDGRSRWAVAGPAEAAAVLREFARPGDLVLLKGSESDHLDRIVEQWGGTSAPSAHRIVAAVDGSVSASDDHYLIVGLGNPEPRYANTPHNVGHDVVDALAARLGARWERHGSVLMAEAAWQECVLHLLKTGTYVNDTGAQMRRIADRLGVGPGQCIVVLDDLHIQPGVVRRRDNGSSGGHHGMQSIIVAFQTESLRRVKVGVGKPPDGDVRSYVLRPFDHSQKPLMETARDRAVEVLLDMMRARAGRAPLPQ
jgi:aminoacyl-tRNA hydrolase